MFNKLKNFTIIDQDIFRNFKSKKYDLPDYGWKIHISAHEKNCKEILKISKQFLIKNNISFKYIKKIKKIKEILSTRKPDNLIGKFITIYPENEKHANFILKNLYKKIKKFTAPLTFSDRQYKGSILHYRYGGITKIDNLHKYVIKRYKPENISDPFQKKQKTNNFINNYKILGLIDFDSFSNIWLVEKDKKMFVLKESKKFFFGGLSNKTRKNEFVLCKKLVKDFFLNHLSHEVINIVIFIYLNLKKVKN
ncbi:hypothetical protein [Mycoplasma leonicaptivi]|uniref:class III lanthionine synthetase LanKC N-terminal domain-containing protein n=1 Tax=Mycoplasma leonicaptivi TaxID=36742 RepID=UPI00048630F1|nr:hypothetical protein [Mycoplasma leonicaptivi]